MNMYNSIEFSKNYLQTCGNSWLYYRDQPTLDNNGIVIIFPLMMTPVFHLNIKKMLLAGQEIMRKNTEIWVPLKYQSNFGELLKCY